jgi:hypothetical protein
MICGSIVQGVYLSQVLAVDGLMSELAHTMRSAMPNGSQCDACAWPWMGSNLVVTRLAEVVFLERLT